MRSIQQILKELPANLETGLDSDGVAQGLVRFGANRLTPLPREPLWKKFLEKFDEPIIKILLAAALLSMLVDLFKVKEFVLGGTGLGLLLAAVIGAYLMRWQQWIPALLFGLAIVLFLLGLFAGHALVEGLAVMVAVILATGVAFLSEYKSDREFEVLNARKDKQQVKVQREGQLHTISLDEVVVGDVVTLEMGDE